MRRGAAILLAAAWLAAQVEPPEAMALARKAFELARAGSAAEAEAALKEAARLAPANPLYRSALGGLLERAGRLEAAVDAFADAVRLDPANATLKARLEKASLECGAALARERRFRAGLALARQTVTRFPDSAPAHIMLGLFLTRNQENVAAVAAYARAAALDPQSPEASVGLAIAQSAAGLNPEAKATFESGLKKFPADATHRVAYGTLLAKLEDPAAAAMFQSALKLDPSLAEAHYQLGRLALERGDRIAAGKHFDAAKSAGLDDDRLRHAIARAARQATPPPARSQPASRPVTARWRQIAGGIAWRHFNGLSPERHLIESTTGGIAFLDYNNDGLMDLLLVNGGRVNPPARHALYRNTGNGRFTEAWSWTTPFYGMGAAAADYDNDGHTDFYLTGFPSGALYHNNGDGTFTLQPEARNEGEWGASAAWFDADNDGRLDLFIANYAEFSFDDTRRCEFEGKPTYCAQTAYKGRRSRLYRNAGQGRFSELPLDMPPSRALGVVAVDYDGDGWQDLFVACDATPNLLLRNLGNGRFEDVGLEAEIAYNADGVARAGMGVDAGDVDGNGKPDFLVTNFDNEYHALYLNPGRLPFREATSSSNLGRLSRFYTGWGVRLLDYDKDGDLDAFIVNGHLNEMIARSNRNVSYREPPLLLSNDGAARFTRVEAGPALATRYVARGLATGDFDNDGAVDAAFISLNETAVVLRNESAPGAAWVGVELRGTRSNRDAIGAKVTLGKMTRWIAGGGSFLASHDRRLVFGLNGETNPSDLEIRWPSGQIQRVSGLAPGRYHTITEP